MVEPITVMGLFQDIDRVAQVLERLRGLGLAEEDLQVLSSLPYSPAMLGRPAPRTRLPWIIVGGAILGFLAGLFLAFGSPNLYVIHVGGQPVVPGPPTAIVLYELTMIGIVLGTFVGLLWQSGFLFRDPRHHEPAVADGRIGVLVRCRPEQRDAVRAALEAEGAEKVGEPERKAL
jgi:hypothetical protein